MITVPWYGTVASGHSPISRTGSSYFAFSTQAPHHPDPHSTSFSHSQPFPHTSFGSLPAPYPVAHVPYPCFCTPAPRCLRSLQHHPPLVDAVGAWRELARNEDGSTAAAAAATTSVVVHPVKDRTMDRTCILPLGRRFALPLSGDGGTCLTS